jgi:two-component system, response regulator YesN
MLRLLIVDDEYGIRTGIASYFPWASLGIEVVDSCQDGEEALSRMAEESVDIVLCDIRMPKMDGIRFARALRERGYRCDIVFMSAYKDFEYAKQAIELGVKNYIVKPAGYEELLEVFSKLAREIGAREAEELRSPSASGDSGDGPGSSSGGLALPERLALLFERELKDLALTTAAERLGMSPNYLSARLRKETGKTFSELLMDARMKRAKELLANREYRVGEIGSLVGYVNSKSFIRAFKAYYGSSPSESRGAPHA